MSKKKQSKDASTEILGEGRVIKNTGSSYIVRLSSGEQLPCRIKGNFRIKGIRTTNPVAVGDIVTVVKAADDADYITAISPRRNYIIRRASNLSKESHILASNIDLAILVASLKDPETPLTFIDRFLATAEAYSVKAAIVLNKEDTWDELDKELAEALHNLYSSIGYPLYFVSAATGKGIPELKNILIDKITLLAGNSGVGKSSLINSLVPGANLRTGEISDIHHTGTHTTTFSEMIDLPGGGALIDIPGVRGFGTIDFAPEEVGHFFPDIFHFARDCRYSDCKHTGEPGCAVIPAVEEHYIAESRYNSYLSILEEASEEAGADKYRKPF
ncbi:MAG: ribosome small subunit-dependent GTPase A [Muribaculaceae bacterium]|nr:ribosome small subunit-dependent GTPase A [Muribaculaceae bacterium]MDE6753878.1 ribosome small subunit-dependent GTPase A [Muribaculaceae bacterium]